MLLRWGVAALAACGLLFGPQPSQGAQVNTVVDSIVYTPTYHNIGIRVYYHGDDDTTATCTGTVKLNGAAGSDTIFTFSRFHGWNRATSGDSARFWASSVFWCGSDSIYKITLTLADASGCTGCTPAEATVTTWPPPNIGVVGKQIWMGPFGSDANSGLSSSVPKRTFASALAAMTTAGDQLRMLAGTYYTMRTDTLLVPPGTKNGTATGRYSVVGDAGVIISGADTTGLDGGTWGATNKVGAGAFAKAFSPAIWPRTVVIDDTLRLYPYNTFYKLASDPQSVVSTWGAYWVTDDGDSVFIRPPTSLGGVLSGHTVHVARSPAAMRVQGDFWRIDSLTFQHFGNGFNQTTIALGGPVVSVTSRNALVQNCEFRNLGRPGVGISYYFDNSQSNTDYATIQRNRFTTYTIGDQWNYPKTRYVGYARGAGATCPSADSTCFYLNITYPQLLVEVGKGHVIRYNHYVGGADGAIRQVNAEARDSSQAQISDNDFYQNNILDIGSDGIEPDSGPFVNCRYYLNTVLGGDSGINMSVYRGPAFFFYNTFINQIRGVLPVGLVPDLDVSRGHQWFINNTWVSGRSDGAGVWTQPQSGTQNAYSNVHVLNNIMAGYSFTTTERGVFKNVLGNRLCEFNYNAGFVHSGGTWSFTTYSGTTRTQATIAAWRDSSYGFGTNDIALPSLAFRDTAHWDWRPNGASTVIGAGQRIKGINASNQFHGTRTAPGLSPYPWPYMGALKPVTVADFSRRRVWWRRFFY
jgi:hypothetical protein